MLFIPLYFMRILAILIYALLTFAATSTSHAADDDLYQQFGGQPGLTRIVDDFVNNLIVDPRISKSFVKINEPRLKKLMLEQFCSLTGGPCTYTGDDMKLVHDGMNLTNADFNAVAEDLQIAMEKAGVPQSAQNKLVAKLAPMQRDVVTK